MWKVTSVACCGGHGGRAVAASQDGSTALILAAWHGHKDMVELLLDRGADLEAKTRVSQMRQLV